VSPVIRREKRASTSLLQRRLRLGYTGRRGSLIFWNSAAYEIWQAKPRGLLDDLDATV
jgi:hypothetical protein